MLAKHRRSDLISTLPQLVRKVSSELSGKWCNEDSSFTTPRGFKFLDAFGAPVDRHTVGAPTASGCCTF